MTESDHSADPRAPTQTADGGPFYDIAVIGGGVNGCGIARDAAGRGLSVYLCEQSDLASGTSSASTKLIHGGLRYLEHYEFRLVREALAEREVVWRIAPHIVRPLRFVLPHRRGMRPQWLLRLGLFLYDHLDGRKLLPPTRRLELSTDEAGAPLKPELRGPAFEYSDCWADDARLVVLNARDAADRGARIETRVKAIAAEAEGGGWRLRIRNQRSGKKRTIRARALVNAAGPCASALLNQFGRPHEKELRLVQGSHVVVPRLFEHDRCYTFQNVDNRIIFAIPYEEEFTLIGTTDRDFIGDPADVVATADEIEYLCRVASAYFLEPVTPADVVWAYSGLRPLLDDGAEEAQAATRDYVLELDDKAGAPILSVFGGKITTYRRVAEQALEKLAPYLRAEALAVGSWTGRTPLPGGDFPALAFSALADTLARRYPWLEPIEARRLARNYGTRAERILGGARYRGELGRDFGAGLTEAEATYLIREEFAVEADDVIWRRTKLGLRLSNDQIDVLRAYMTGQKGSLDMPPALTPDAAAEGNL